MDERCIKNRNRGFSLVELIIVIAIMAILVGVLAPQYIKYVSKSRESVCNYNVAVIQREYATEVALNQYGSINEARNGLAEIMTKHGAALAGAPNGIYNGGSYSGICKEDGNYNCMIADDFSALTIDCTKHGLIDIVTFTEKLNSLTVDTTTGRYKNLADYFVSNTGLDSTAVNTGGNNNLYAPYSSFAEAIGAALTNSGIDVSNRSWRMYKDSSQYNIFMTNRLITMEDVGKTVACTKYDIVNNKTIYGTITVVKSSNGSYPVLSGGTFKETK